MPTFASGARATEDGEAEVPKNQDSTNWFFQKAIAAGKPTERLEPMERRDEAAGARRDGEAERPAGLDRQGQIDVAAASAIVLFHSA